MTKQQLYIILKYVREDLFFHKTHEDFKGSNKIDFIIFIFQEWEYIKLRLGITNPIIIYSLCAVAFNRLNKA